MFGKFCQNSLLTKAFSCDKIKAVLEEKMKLNKSTNSLTKLSEEDLTLLKNEPKKFWAKCKFHQITKIGKTIVTRH